MRQLSIDDSRAIIHSYVKSYGQRGAAKALTRGGYRSPEGHEIRQGHISRILAGSYTCLMAPEKAISAPAPSPIAARLPVAEPYPEHCIESGPAPASPSSQKREGNLALPFNEEAGEDQEDLYDVRAQLRDELEAEEAARQEKEMNLPPLVPSPRDHSRSEHTCLARPHAVFSRRGPVEIKTDEEGNEETYFGIPKLKHRPSPIMSRPYQPKSYGENVVSTR
jgi:hypothetical protein